MARESSPGVLARLPLFLLLTGCAALSMYVPAIYAVVQDNHPASQSFFYAGTLGLICVTLVALALGAREPRYGALGQLLSLFATFTFLPLFLAVPVHDALRNTSFLNAYFDMVSAVTTTGANIYENPARLSDPLHLWRAQVAWLGGMLMWIAAAAILAPLSLGGFEVTARAAPGRGDGLSYMGQTDARKRLSNVAAALIPTYAGLTVVVWIALIVTGDSSLVALSHAMSVMSTSGISPVGGLGGAQSGLGGEVVLFFFMFFALSRLTFANDTVSLGQGRLDKDPEFRIGIVLVVGVPVLLFLRHWLGAYDVAAAEDGLRALKAFWGSMFTVMSFVTTTGFESNDWDTAQRWSGLETPGLILMGLALIGGGVATTAGGVKLLRVFALYLNGLREMERLVHPSSVGNGPMGSLRIRRDGAFLAWIFFMMFAMSLACVTVVLAALGVGFDQAILLSIAMLSTTGPLIEMAAETPVRLAELSAASKLVLCGAMVLGRLETLAIVALVTTDFWRN